MAILIEFDPANECYSAQSLAVGELTIRAATKSLAIVQDSIECRCCDVKGNGNDPFVSVIGSHGTRKDSNGARGRDTFYGIVGGADYRWNIGSEGNKYLRGGAFFGYLHGDMHGAALPSLLLKSVWDSKLTIKQTSAVGGLFCAFEQFDSRLRKSNLDASLCFGRQKNRISGGDEAAYRGHSFSVDLRAIGNVFARNSWQIGPWIGASYGRIGERGSFFGATESKVSSDIFRTIIGLNVEHEFSPSSKNPELLLRTYGRVGWCWQGGRSSVRGNNISATFPPPPSTFDGAFGDRNSAIATAGFRQKLTANWEVSGSLNGDFSCHYSLCKATLTVGYCF
jgi:outer membrane autotransporter protein